jgi:beta-N-acetylhexosaminidase
LLCGAKVVSGSRSQGPPKAAIVGCAGLALTNDEQRLFAANPPLGLIVFGRNCDTREQLRALVAQFRAVVGRADAPVLIDQEGGRVARLRPPHWPAVPAPGAIVARFADDEPRLMAALRAASDVTCAMLFEVGITVNCVPMADVRAPQAHAGVIGDRALGDTPEQVARLARVVADAHLHNGILPVLKHLPGHGRATADSHADLPRVDADADSLLARDGLPFRRLADCPLGMTAHVVYPAWDAENPATLSPTIVADVIRGALGFRGLLLSDDLHMSALTGPMDARAVAALAAGCDVALYCKADPADNAAVLAAVPVLSGAALTRWQRAEALRKLWAQAPSGDGILDRAVAAFERAWVA